MQERRVLQGFAFRKRPNAISCFRYDNNRYQKAYYCRPARLETDSTPDHEGADRECEKIFRGLEANTLVEDQQATDYGPQDQSNEIQGLTGFTNWSQPSEGQ